MGYRYAVKCAQCEHKFSINEGGGFFFHLNAVTRASIRSKFLHGKVPHS